jgi:hypothetical protein
VLPVIIFVCIAIPLLVIAFVAVRRSKKTTEHLAEAEGTSEAEMEREFAAAEAYEEKWRDEQHGQSKDGSP